MCVHDRLWGIHHHHPNSPIPRIGIQSIALDYKAQQNFHPSIDDPSNTCCVTWQQNNVTMASSCSFARLFLLEKRILSLHNYLYLSNNEKIPRNSTHFQTVRCDQVHGAVSIKFILLIECSFGNETLDKI